MDLRLKFNCNLNSYEIGFCDETTCWTTVEIKPTLSEAIEFMVQEQSKMFAKQLDEIKQPPAE